MVFGKIRRHWHLDVGVELPTLSERTDEFPSGVAPLSRFPACVRARA